MVPQCHTSALGKLVANRMEDAAYLCERAFGTIERSAMIFRLTHDRVFVPISRASTRRHPASECYTRNAQTSVGLIFSFVFLLLT